MEIFKLFGSIFVDNEKANKSIDDTDKKAGGLGGKLSGMIGTAAKMGAGIAAGGAVAVGAIAGLAMKANEAASNLDDMSKRTGSTAEEFQKYAYAAKLSGMETETLEKAMIKQQKAFADAQEGSKTASEAYQRLGIDINSIGSSGDAFDAVIKKLADMGSETERNALANDIFGKSYAELTPMLMEGSAGIEAMKKEAAALGAVMSNESVAAGAKFGDTLDSVKMALEGVVNKVGVAVLPILTDMLNWVMANLPQIQATFQTVFDAIGFVADIFIDVVRGIIGWVSQWAQDNEAQTSKIKDLFMKFFESVKGFITAFVEFATKFWAAYGDSIMSVVKFAFDFISVAISTYLNLITDVFNIFSALFRGDWEGLWTGAKDFFLDVWDGIYGGIKATINLIIRAINGMVERMNQISFSIPSWVPGLGGKSWGFNLPHIPELARGGDLLESGLVKVGELGPEILQLPKGARVSPLSGGAGGAQSIFGRGAFEGAIIMDDYGVDRLMDRIGDRMAAMGVG